MHYDHYAYLRTYGHMILPKHRLKPPERSIVTFTVDCSCDDPQLTMAPKNVACGFRFEYSYFLVNILALVPSGLWMIWDTLTLHMDYP